VSKEDLKIEVRNFNAQKALAQECETAIDRKLQNNSMRFSPRENF
jgi:hypothetical protein